MSINYNDERFGKVEEEKQAALSKNEQIYDGMINDTDKYYQDMINASNKWSEEQKDIQNKQTDFAIEQINQQKDQAHKDYLKEQTASYNDYVKASNRYGANAEQMASSGLSNSGYSESSMVSMYNTYQNRVATARESYSRAVLNYDNAIKDARLQNNALLAQIAYEALQKQLELSLQGFQYKNQLILDKADKETEINNTYYSRYKDVIDQINTENALAEEKRQFDENLLEEQRQFNLTNSTYQIKDTPGDTQDDTQDDTTGNLITYTGSSNATGQGKAALDRKDIARSTGQGVNRGTTYTIDTNSLNSCAKILGMNSLTANQANKLVEQGVLNEVEKNGMIGFTVNAKYAQTKYIPSSAKRTLPKTNTTGVYSNSRNRYLS